MATPASAASATVSKSSDGILFLADNGIANRVTTEIVTFPLQVIFRDASGPITSGAGCTQFGANAVSCPLVMTAQRSDTIAITLGDLADTHRFQSPFFFPGGGLLPPNAAPVRIFLGGGTGDDRFEAGTGAGVPTRVSYVGGPNIDTISFEGAYGSQAILDTFENDGPTGDQNHNIDLTIENIEGSAGPDRIGGSVERNVITGKGGDDVIDGFNGNDTIDGGAGVDTLEGGIGNDELRGGAGGDTFNGGPGSDTVFFDTDPPASTGAGVEVTLDDNMNNDGAVERITLSPWLCRQLNCTVVLFREGDNVKRDVENVIGTPRADTIIGNPAMNRLVGLGGNDTLDGVGGIDTADGGAGTDTCRAETRIACELPAPQ
jgi:Ca2+-binding RTX toxin-like protein